jgi:hypothetical protein
MKKPSTSIRNEKRSLLKTEKGSHMQNMSLPFFFDF